MARESTLLLDLDALAEPTHHITWQDKEHPMVPLSVSDFIANIRETQQAEASRGLDGEAELLVNMLARTFPSIGVDSFMTVPVAGLWALLAVTQRLQNPDGSGNSESTEANPPAAAADAS